MKLLDIYIFIIFIDTFEGIEEERRVSPRARQLERLLASKLTEFLTADFVCSLRKVLPAEMSRVYVGPGKSETFFKNVN